MLASRTHWIGLRTHRTMMGSKVTLVNEGENIGASPEHIEQELAAIAQKIVALWEAHASSGRPYLVSALGIDLGKDLSRLKEISGISLTAFIRRHLSEKVQLIRLGAHSNVDALIAREAALSDLTNIPLGQPRYNRRFWAAFLVPPAGRRRLLDLADFTFNDDDHETQDVPTGKIPIDQAYIVHYEVADRNDIVKTHIESWLAAHNLSADRFLQQKSSPEPASVCTKTRTGSSVLEAMIEALDRRQLQTTQLSLDVVAALLKTRLS
jgi:hypothetical protein